VVEVQPVGGHIFDIETLEEEQLSYEVDLCNTTVCKVSISYDIQKLDEMDAGQFLHLVKLYLDDPDMMLL